MLARWIELLNSIVGKNGSRLEETDSYLTLRFQFSLEVRADVLMLLDPLPEVFTRLSIYHHGIAENLDSISLNEDCLSHGDDCSLILQKSTDAAMFFITVAGFEKSIEKITGRSVIFVNSVEHFSSISCEFLPLAEYVLEPNVLNRAEDYESSFATFLTGRVDSLIDLHIPFFIQKGCGSVDGPYATVWKNKACKYLINFLGSKIESADDGYLLVAKSEKKITFSIDNYIDVNAYDALQDVARWISLPRRDAKVRHQIYLGCLVRQGSPEESAWSLLLSCAEHVLEAAQLNYDSLLDKEARESLKVMIDLRKAVFDAASQISKDAQEISGRVAADIAAVVGLFLARITLMGKGSIEPWLGEMLLVAAILYVGYRTYSVLFVSKKFFESTNLAREAWNKRVYSSLSLKDREDLSEQPIERAMRTLGTAVDTAGIAYAIILFVLIFSLFLN